MKFTTHLSTALLTILPAISAYPTTPPQSLTPDTISLYHGYGGRIEYDVPRGKVERKQNGNDDISTLLTFTFPEATRGRKCELNFELNDNYVWTGNFAIDAFTSSQYATADSPGWGPPSNYRDVSLGRFRLVRGGLAGVEWGNMVFDCPAGETRGFEVTPTGDEVLVEWDAGLDGPWIRWW